MSCRKLSVEVSLNGQKFLQDFVVDTVSVSALLIDAVPVGVAECNAGNNTPSASVGEGVAARRSLIAVNVGSSATGAPSSSLFPTCESKIAQIWPGLMLMKVCDLSAS